MQICVEGAGGSFVLLIAINGMMEEEVDVCGTRYAGLDIEL